MDEIFVAIQDAANTIAAPNWADKLSVLLSLLAILAAGLVAWRQNKISRKQTDIADKQNKIALFEKRLEIYEILSSCCASVEILKMASKNEDILRYLFISLKRNSRDYREFNSDEARLYLTNCSKILQHATFFFSEEIASYIFDVSVELLILANSDAKADGIKKYNKKKQNYFETIKYFDENDVLESIEAEMKMI